MVNNKTIENELKSLRHDIYDLFLRINQLKNEVHKMNMENNGLIYEQYITVINNEDEYTFKHRAENTPKIINLVRKAKGSAHCSKYDYSNSKKGMLISYKTTKIIETYIPSKNLVLVVEL